MPIIEFEKNSPEPGSAPTKADETPAATSSDIQSILEMTKSARDRAHKLGLSFEAYLLQTAVLALADQFDPKK